LWGRPRPATLWKMQSTSRADGGPSPGKPSVESNAKPSLPQATCRAADSRRRNDRPQRTALGVPSLRACMQHCDAVTRARSHPVILTDCRGRARRSHGHGPNPFHARTCATSLANHSSYLIISIHTKRGGPPFFRVQTSLRHASARTNTMVVHYLRRLWTLNALTPSNSAPPAPASALPVAMPQIIYGT